MRISSMSKYCNSKQQTHVCWLDLSIHNANLSHQKFMKIMQSLLATAYKKFTFKLHLFTKEKLFL